MAWRNRWTAVAAAAMGVGGGDERWRRRALQWETAMAVARSRWVVATAAVAQWKARRRRDHNVQHRDRGGWRRL